MTLYRKPIVLRLVGIITCLGSLAGLVTTVNGFVADDGGSTGFSFLSIAFIYFFAGLYIGAKLALDQGQSQRQCLWFWWIQVPVLNSAYFSFHAATGAFCALWLRLDVYDAGFAFGIASQFEISLMAGGPVAIGVNVLALAIVLSLRRVVRAKAVTI